MKRVLMLLLVGLLLLSVIGCGSPVDNESASSSSSTTSTQPSSLSSTTSTQPSISDRAITEAMLSFRYPAGAFSVPLKDLLPKCCPDYKGTFTSYEELKTDKLSEEQIQKYESSNIKELLDNSYFVTLTGCITENPEVPYLVTENKEILTLLILFDDNDNVAGHIIVNSCSELETCAIIIATSY